MKQQKWTKAKPIAVLLAFMIALIGGMSAYSLSNNIETVTTTKQTTKAVTIETNKTSEKRSDEEVAYVVSDEEKAYLKERFDKLAAINSDVIGYIYAPGTPLDEPVVQTTDNEHYLQYMFEGGYDNYIGTVFMDKENDKNYTDQLTWMFGHARGSMVSDTRAFATVNFYEDKAYFKENPYFVIETPEKKLYYEVAFFVVVPETTAFYKTSFKDDDEFVEQLNAVKEEARVVNEDIVIDKNDQYLVLSTCREEDPTIRTNLYLRKLTDEEIPALIEAEGSNLDYVAKR